MVEQLHIHILGNFLVTQTDFEVVRVRPTCLHDENFQTLLPKWELPLLESISKRCCRSAMLYNGDCFSEIRINMIHKDEGCKMKDKPRIS